VATILLSFLRINLPKRRTCSLYNSPPEKLLLPSCFHLSMEWTSLDEVDKRARDIRPVVTLPSEIDSFCERLCSLIRVLLFTQSRHTDNSHKSERKWRMDLLSPLFAQYAEQGLSNGRTSVCPSICRNHLHAAAVRPPGSKYRSIAARLVLSSKCEQCHVDSWRRKLNRDLFFSVLNFCSSWILLTVFVAQHYCREYNRHVC